MGWVTPIRLGSESKTCHRCGLRIGVPGEVLGWVGKLCQCPAPAPNTDQQRIAELEERVARLERGPTRY